ncbi:MAG: DNA-nicking Smr family endonuclease [Pseudohongiellaceae bacterium]|jgi:DNA-nicking Smr family endonuclease
MNHDGELDKQIFLEETIDVKPLKQTRVTQKKFVVETPGQAVRRSLAVDASKLVDPLVSAGIQNLKSNDVLAFRHDGVQHGVYKKLRMGHYVIDACLDLHRMLVEEARKEVFGFINECQRYDLRVVIILHGKGDRNPDNIATLKSHLAVWLPQIDEVLAFHSALRQHGGTGAVYVMLKKSAQAKQANREQYGLK